MQQPMSSVRPSVRLSVCSTRYQPSRDLKFGTQLELVLLTPESMVQMLRTKPVQNGGQIKMAAFLGYFAYAETVQHKEGHGG